MQLLQTRAELEAWRNSSAGRPLHCVPTMGALHGGHGSLIQHAGSAAPGKAKPLVLTSVFVNPLQFGPNEDFALYPRCLEDDLQLAQAAGADALFAPSVEEIYPQGERELTRIHPPPSLQEGLCGRHRQGHFGGVATVVVRLLALIRPQVLVLGEKDWQQLVIMRRVISDLGLPIQVLGCPTLREADGLAMSSRNRYLSTEERRQAAVMPQALQQAAARCLQQKGIALAPLEAEVRHALERADMLVEYVEAVKPLCLQAQPRLSGLTLLAVAAHCGPSRLIDHVFLMSRAPIIAIDGPAGAGKSTVTRAFAERLGLIYLDTGAMYRAVTWLVQERGVKPSSAEEVAPLLAGLDLQLSSSANGQRVSVNGVDVTQAIRSPEVTAQVSVVAAHGCVREALTLQQQAMGGRGGLVAEGRDIGTAVFPDAELKVFLTATVSERARRRALDLEQRGFEVPALADLEAQIAERDHLDSTRSVAPLTKAEDAVELTTDGMTIDSVIQRLVDLFRERVPHDAW